MPPTRKKEKKVRYYFQFFNKQKRKNKTVHTCHEELVVDKLVQELLKQKKMWGSHPMYQKTKMEGPSQAKPI